MVKIDIISGFLGAGKTTLIQKLLAEAFQDTKLVLIENEFGEIGIDSGFLQETGVKIQEINAGCICCSLAGDFKKALQEVLDTYHPERIIIEPSGVGKLSDVVQAVESAGDNFTICGKITVVDVNKCKLYLKNFGAFFLNQVQTADTILLSRTGGASSQKVEQAVHLLRQHNDHAVIVTTPWEQWNSLDLLREMEQKQDFAAALLDEVQQHHAQEAQCSCSHTHHAQEEQCGCGHAHTKDEQCGCSHTHPAQEAQCSCGHAHHTQEEQCSCGHAHAQDEQCSCNHEQHRADDVFVSWGLETPAVYTAETVQDLLKALEQQAVYGMVLRAKGMLPAADGVWTYFDYVPGQWQIRKGKPAVIGKVCVIGSGLKQDALQQLFQQ